MSQIFFTLYHYWQDTAILLYVDQKSSATAYSITPFKALIGAIIRQNDKLLKIFSIAISITKH
jgi:hypothetical protein